MFTQLLKTIKNHRYLFLSFLVGLPPAIFIIHIIPVDFSGYYFQAVSFLKHHEYAYQIIENYCGNPINSGLNARAPFVPLAMALSMGLFGTNLFGALLPFLLARLIITPLTYLVAKKYLPDRIAFLASLLTLFFPKLHTYSLAAPESDVFITLFYLCAIYFYTRSNQLTQTKYAVLTGISIGLGALCKSIGLGIGIGFIAAILLHIGTGLVKRKTRNNFFALIIYFILLIGPYLLWTVGVHRQLYITTQHDKSISYIAANLPSLIWTVPLYLGLNFSIGIKAAIISVILLGIFIFGLLRSMLRKQFILTVPTLITLVLISMLSTCSIGGAIPFNFEFATILGFMMFPVAILFFIGLESILKLIKNIFSNRLITAVTINLLLIFVLYKFINNYFSARYALNFVPNEYYVSLPTLITKTEPLPEINFVREHNLRIFKGPTVHALIREQFKAYKFDPFSLLYIRLLSGVSIIAIVICLFDSREKVTD